MAQGLCMKNPPTAVAIPSQNRISGAVDIGIRSVRPPVMGDDYCSGWGCSPTLTIV